MRKKDGRIDEDGTMDEDGRMNEDGTMDEDELNEEWMARVYIRGLRNVIISILLSKGS